jgi:hypothetical protein
MVLIAVTIGRGALPFALCGGSLVERFLIGRIFSDRVLRDDRLLMERPFMGRFISGQFPMGRPFSGRLIMGRVTSDDRFPWHRGKPVSPERRNCRHRHNKRPVSLQAKLLATMGAERSRVRRVLYPDVANGLFDRIRLKNEAAFFDERSDRFLINLYVAVIVDFVGRRGTGIVGLVGSWRRFQADFLGHFSLLCHL